MPLQESVGVSVHTWMTSGGVAPGVGLSLWNGVCGSHLAVAASQYAVAESGSGEADAAAW